MISIPEGGCDQIVMSPDQWDALVRQFQCDPKFKLGHLSPTSLLGIPVIISKSLPPGQILMISNKDLVHQRPQLTVTIPQLTATEALFLLGQCDFRVYEDGMGMTWRLELHQGGKQVGQTTLIGYEDVLIHGPHYLTLAGKGDRGAVETLLRRQMGALAWLDLEDVE